MMDRVTLDSGKSVLLSERYDPKRAMLAEFKGREPELQLIFASWIGSNYHPPLCPLMVGEPGVGKNRIVFELAAITGLDLYIVQGHEDITAEDLACSVRFADDAKRGVDYVLSPLVTAMYTGGLCFFDEIGKTRPRALSPLVSVLDERRYIDSTMLGERIVAKSTFRFVSATNTGEEHELPEFIRSRLKPVVQVNHPSKEEIENIISTQEGIRVHRDALLKKFWELWSKRSDLPTPRDAIQLFALAGSLCSFRKAGGEALVARALERQSSEARDVFRGFSLPDIEVRDLEVAFQDLFDEDIA